MIRRKMILLTGLLFAAACDGNGAAAPTETVPEVSATPPAVVDAAAASQEAPQEEASLEVAPMRTEAAGRTASPTPQAEAAMGASEEEAAVAPKAAAPEPDAVALCDGRPTPSNPEGPFYSPGSPERTSLIEEGMEGTPITIRGLVLNTDCEPVVAAKIDFWQTDAAGQYDNEGYRLRGHQFTDEDGRYSLETIIPGQYPGRPAHIHLKIFSSEGREMLTSQLYIPGLSEGVPDGFFDRELLVRLAAADGGEQTGFFNFVVP
jgi:protocatechuate 3,4-dioxygenase beta subunit